MSSNDDERLIARVREGDFAAFEVLYNKYKGEVYRTSLAIIQDKDAAEDILQDCFLKLYTNIDKIDGSIPLSLWLHRVTVNLSYNWAIKHSRWLNFLKGMLEGLVASNPTSPESILEKKELSHIVREAIDSLKFEHRVVLILFYLKNFNLKEIAYILNCPIGTVKSRLYYGRKNLKRKLMSDRILEGEVAYELP